DDFLEVESDVENVYDDPFDSKGEKIKESKLLIDELDLPGDFLPPFEYDSFISRDFSRVDVLPSTNNEDKDFDPPFYEPLFCKEVPKAKMLLPFLSENEKKVKENQEKDKIGTKPDKIKIRREAWKSPAMSKSSHSQENRKT
nr:hypothetical protein [Tanacetum cinerariifolium]